jgi:hypothetical protein
VPARPSGEGSISVEETFGGVGGKMKSGARREVEPGLTAFARNFESYQSTVARALCSFGSHLSENT